MIIPLCGWEALGEVPSESSFSRYFDDFAEDGTALLAFNAFVAKVSEGRVAMNASFDSTKVEARERAATSGEKAAEATFAAPPEASKLQNSRNPARGGAVRRHRRPWGRRPGRVSTSFATSSVCVGYLFYTKKDHKVTKIGF